MATVTCRAHHVLVPFTKSPGEGSNVCDQCDNRIPNGDPMHQCAACDYDLCPECCRRAAGEVVVGDLVTAASLRIGARVKRGPDWKWGEQDGPRYEEDGQWDEEDGQWYQEDGQWYQEDGQWYQEDG
eukprot:CAMPEP_0204312980 /NCGR_PEP_ID=MMETSP0469-20131031/3311_1 /ASSEMBLY_ACC=CAM_ASM_000384 /TAXON_ID=2969 /ORGANISM="Oxyrrhis marina" /LENGTH=126 /DNA_ID=CAMNT_0051293197 /DNA_START=22 /DNA_END=398 /DNA_ORIENTATION=-